MVGNDPSVCKVCDVGARANGWHEWAVDHGMLEGRSYINRNQM